MPDEPKELPDQPQEPQKTPLASMFDRWSKDPSPERDIHEEIKSEFEQKKDEIPKKIDFEESKRNLGDAFDRAYKHFRRKEKGDIGVYLISDDRQLTIRGEGGEFNVLEPGNPPLDWDPEVIVVQSVSPLGGGDENRRMHTKSYAGENLPQYFRTDLPSIGMITNSYSYDKNTNSWSKEEWIGKNVFAPAYLRNDRFEPNNLQTITNSHLDKLIEIHASQPEKLPLDDNDYEQLQTILHELDKGEFVRDISDEVDAD